MKVSVYVSVFVEGTYPQQSIGPEEHDSHKGQTIKAKTERVQTDIILELCLDLVIAVQELANEVTVNGADDSEYTSYQAVKLSLIDSYPIFEVINNEDKDWSEEVDCIYDRQGQIKLGCCDRDSMQHHDAVALQQIAEINIVFVVQGHAVVAGDEDIEDDVSYSPEKGSFNGADTHLVGVQKGEWE